jgi:hypothetical protein
MEEDSDIMPRAFALSLVGGSMMGAIFWVALGALLIH